MGLAQVVKATDFTARIAKALAAHMADSTAVNMAAVQVVSAQATVLDMAQEQVTAKRVLDTAFQVSKAHMAGRATAQQLDMVLMPVTVQVQQATAWQDTAQAEQQ